MLDLELFPFNSDHLSKYNEILRAYDDYIQTLRTEMMANRYNNDTEDISEFYNKIQIKDVKNMDLNSISRELPIRNLSQLNLDQIETLYSKGIFNVHVISTTFKQKKIAVKIFKLNNSIQTKLSLCNQTRLMYSLGQDSGFIQLYGSFMASLPLQIKSHLNIDSLDEYGVLIMEYCDFDLQIFMSTKSKQERELLALEFGQTLIQSMKRLNNKGIKHKDIKPQNILVQIRDGKPFLKIADFDVSSSYQKVQEKTIIDKTNVVGTVNYAAPELRLLLESKEKGKKILNSNKADVYSLGITLFQVVVQPTEKIELNTSSDGQDLQVKVSRLIDEMIENENLKIVMKALMVVDPNKRMSFRDFEQDSEVTGEETVKNYDLDDMDEFEDV